MGQIPGPSTSRKRAAATKYSENWHNFTLLTVLSGPSGWQTLTGTDRCINLTLGANWCMVQLNVPIDELDVTITTPAGQPFPNAISPPRQAHDPEDQALPSEAGTPNPSLPDTDPLELDATDDGVPLYDLFSSPTDKNTSNSYHSSIALSQDDLDNAGRSNTAPPPSAPELDPNLERKASTSSWVLGTVPPIKSPTLPPGNGQASPDATMACSEVTGYSQLIRPPLTHELLVGGLRHNSLHSRKTPPP